MVSGLCRVKKPYLCEQQASINSIIQWYACFTSSGLGRGRASLLKDCHRGIAIDACSETKSWTLPLRRSAPLCVLWCFVADPVCLRRCSSESPARRSAARARKLRSCVTSV